MTVRELIEALSILEPDAEVVVDDSEWGHLRPDEPCRMSDGRVVIGTLPDEPPS